MLNAVKEKNHSVEAEKKKESSLKCDSRYLATELTCKCTVVKPTEYANSRGSRHCILRRNVSHERVEWSTRNNAGGFLRYFKERDLAAARKGFTATELPCDVEAIKIGRGGRKESG